MSLVHLIKKSKNQNPDTEVVFDSNNIQSLAKDHNRILINLTDEREVEIKFQFPKKSDKPNYSLIEFTALWDALLCLYKGQSTDLVTNLFSCELNFKRCKTVEVNLNVPDEHYVNFLAVDTVPVKAVDK